MHISESTPTPPQYIFWYPNDKMVNHDVERGVKVTTSSDSTRTESKLTFETANKRDEGNYTCSPSNSAPATVQLFVTRSKPLTAESMPKYAADPVMKQAISGGSRLMPSLAPSLPLQIGIIFGAVAYIKPS